MQLLVSFAFLDGLPMFVEHNWIVLLYYRSDLYLRVVWMSWGLCSFVPGFSLPLA